MDQVTKRANVGRVVRRTVSRASAAETIGELTPGCEIFGLSKGQFSLVDIIEHVLKYTGPASVLLSTWTAANADLTFAYELLRNGSIMAIRFVVDFSFSTRQPEYCAALREKFGDDAVRVTKTHAKFVVIRNAAWSVVIRSSMNLNENRRLESFEISDCRQMADFCEEVVDALFESQRVGEGFTNGPYQNMQAFQSFLEEGAAAPVDVKRSTDTAKYFGDGRYDNDIRRAGRVQA